MAISGIVRPDPGKNKILGALCALSDYKERAVVFCASIVTTSKKPALRSPPSIASYCGGQVAWLKCCQIVATSEP